MQILHHQNLMMQILKKKSELNGSLPAQTRLLVTTISLLTATIYAMLTVREQNNSGLPQMIYAVLFYSVQR